MEKEIKMAEAPAVTQDVAVLSGSDTSGTISENLQADVEILPRILEPANNETCALETPRVTTGETQSVDNSPPERADKRYGPRTNSLTQQKNGQVSHDRDQVPVPDESFSKSVSDAQGGWKESQLQELPDLPLALVRHSVKVHTSSASQSSPLSNPSDETQKSVDMSAAMRLSQQASSQAACEAPQPPQSAGFSFNSELHHFETPSPDASAQISSASQSYQDGIAFYSQLEHHGDITNGPSAASRFTSGVDYAQDCQTTKTFSNLIPSPTTLATVSAAKSTKASDHASFVNNVATPPWNAYNNAATTVATTAAIDYTTFQQYSDYTRHYPNVSFEGQRSEAETGLARTSDLETLQHCQGLQQHMFAQHAFGSLNFPDADKYLHDSHLAGKSSQVVPRPTDGEESSATVTQRMKLLRSLPPDPLRWTATHVKTWLNVLAKMLDGTEVLDVDEIPDVTGRELCNMAVDDLAKYVRSTHVAGKLITELTKRREAVLAVQNTDDSTAPPYSRFVQESGAGSSQGCKSDGLSRGI